MPTPIDGSVYFDVLSDDDYGKLSNRRVDEQQDESRDLVGSGKRHPADFALWKRAEPEHILRWNSPWGVGFPGWHIECSAMAKKYLGANFDIHGGGIDNIYPHNENEIAQSECANDCGFANYWMLTGSLNVLDPRRRHPGQDEQVAGQLHHHQGRAQDLPPAGAALLHSDFALQQSRRLQRGGPWPRRKRAGSG